MATWSSSRRPELQRAARPRAATRERNARVGAPPRPSAWCLLALLAVAAPQPPRLRAAETTAVDWAAVGQEAAAFLAEYIRIDTTNPPGNEVAAAEFLAARFRAEGVEARVFQSEEGRGAVLARLRGTGSARPIVLLNHLDVVPAEAGEWTHGPFAGDVADGYVYGRGALDMKGPAIVQAMALILLHRTGAALARDVFFLGTPDEETGGRRGAGWFAGQHLAELGQPEFVLNEGGFIRQYADGSRAWEVAVAEKTPLWVRLTASGEGGHGSVPRGEGALNRLIRALERIRTFDTGIRVVPEVAKYYRARAALETGERRRRFADLRGALADPAFRKAFLASPRDAALVRNTISPTVLRGSSKTNVIPSTAIAELDCRLLPGQDADAFLAALKRRVGDEHVRFEVLLRFPPSSSPPETELYRAIEAAAASEGARVVPSVLTGFTDSHWFRERGMVAYGFVPIVLTEAEEQRVHGADERLSVQNLREGTRRLVAILHRLGRS